MKIRTKPMITVIVPIFNTSDYLDKCLNSVKEQTYKNFEVLMINDGSTDNSKKICEKFSRIDNRFLLINQSNHGLSYSRNRGLDIAHGKFIFFIDSDDYIDNNLLQTVIPKMLLNNIDLFAFGYYEQFGMKKVRSKYKNPNLMEISSEIALYHLFRGSFGSYAWHFVATKKLYMDNNIHFPINKLYEDIATTYKLLGNAHNIYISSDELYYYRQHAQSITHTQSSYNLNDMLDVFPEMDYFIYKNYPNLRNELYRFQFNTICMILIGMEGWNRNLYNLFRPHEKKQISYFKKTVKILISICKESKQLDEPFTKQKIKLMLIRLHIFPFIIFFKSKI
ncbi:glycosyltransferase family 2 protein [Lentilactobacillus buchneri]|uniref:glycosyltransferase family 2 protein n=1 Tax=Lentilactobacillus buchneri TaxID=1581 RepID=UPI00345EAE48